MNALTATIWLETLLANLKACAMSKPSKRADMKAPMAISSAYCIDDFCWKTVCLIPVAIIGNRSFPPRWQWLIVPFSDTSVRWLAESLHPESQCFSLINMENRMQIINCFNRSFGIKSPRGPGAKKSPGLLVAKQTGPMQDRLAPQLQGHTSRCNQTDLSQSL